MRHQAAARLVSQYDVNNTYQYIINREEVQLSWLAKAIEELGGAVPADAAAVDRAPAGKGADAARAVIDEDGRDGAGVRGPLAAAHRHDGQCPPRENARRHSW